MEWRNEFRTGVVQLDEHHRYFLRLISTLDEEGVQNWSPDRFRVLLREVQRFVHYHFRAEEEWMDACGYTARASHRAEHDEIRCRVDEFLDRAEKGAIEVDSLRSFLFGWFMRHTAVSDPLLAEQVLQTTAPAGTVE